MFGELTRMAFCMAALSAGIASAAGLEAGFSRVDITPPMGVDMTGYFVRRTAKTVLDPLQVNCLAFADGVTTAVVMQVDCCLMCDAFCDAVIAEVMRRNGLGRGQVFVHSSHTHDSGNLDDLTLGGVNRTYREMVVSRCVDAAAFAIADAKPAELGCGRSAARRISFGRRYRMKDGSVRTNPGVGNSDIVGPAGEPPDDEVQVLRIDRKGAAPICVINFQTHPDVVGGETVTADWPGLTRGVFEAATFGKTRCLVLNGAQGDVNHVNVMPRPGEGNGLYRDFDDVDRGYDHARHMANVLAAAALSVWMKCEPLKAGPIRCATSSVRVPSQRVTDAEQVAWARRVQDLHDAGRDAELEWKGMALTTELARARRILSLEKGPDFFELPLIALAIGDELAAVGFPGEPFNAVGREIKRRSPFKLTLLSCITNASRGYFPDAAAFEQGGYESAQSPFGPSVAADLVTAELGLLRALRRPCRFIDGKLKKEQTVVGCCH